MEWWSGGVVEYWGMENWSVGVMEWCGDGKERRYRNINLLIHYSITPSRQGLV